MASGLTGTYLFPYPLQTDPVDVAADVQALAQGIESTMVLKAPLASPALTGVPTAPTPNNADSSTTIATTAFVKNQGYLTAVSGTSTFMPLAGGTFTGAVGVNGSPIASTTAPLQISGDLAFVGTNRSILGNVYFLSGWKYAANGYGWGFRDDGAGKVQFLSAPNNTGGAGAAASVDLTSLLTIDLANNRLGLGVVSPPAKFSVSASTTTAASINVPHGTAPSSPTNGDIWTTTIGMYARINGNTVGPFGTGATYTNSAPTAITGALWANSDYNSLSVYTGSRWASMTGTPPVSKTATYTLALGDEGTVLVMSGGTTNNITVPTNASVAFPVGSSIMVVQTSAIQTVISGAGVTFNATPGLKLRAQYSVATLLKIATDTWVVTGDLVA